MNDLQNKIAVRGILTLSREAARSALRSDNPDCARVLLWLALNPEENDLSKAEKALSVSRERLDAALSALGLADGEGKPEKAEAAASKKPPVQALPDYTGEELSEALSDAHFAFLCHQAERCFQRPLRRHECSTLLALYEDVGIPAEVLALVLTYCAQRASDGLAEGANVRMSFAQVRTEAMRWYESGVDTAEKAEAHIRSLEEKRRLSSRVLHILGIENRRPSPTELGYIDNFLTLDPSLALIAKAYDITVTNRGSLVWRYMQSILMRWYERGYRTIQDVENGESRRRGKPAKGARTDDLYEDEVMQFLESNEKE